MAGPSEIHRHEPDHDTNANGPGGAGAASFLSRTSELLGDNVFQRLTGALIGPGHNFIKQYKLKTWDEFVLRKPAARRVNITDSENRMRKRFCNPLPGGKDSVIIPMSSAETCNMFYGAALES